ncbi:MAG: transposase [Hyphomicrobium sp.]|nr:transposase [Hyphomicrobium sp.]
MSRRRESIPGVGPITASVIAASVIDGRQFQNGRQFAAWLRQPQPEHTRPPLRSWPDAYRSASGA